MSAMSCFHVLDRLEARIRSLRPATCMAVLLAAAYRRAHPPADAPTPAPEEPGDPVPATCSACDPPEDQCPAWCPNLPPADAGRE